MSRPPRRGQSGREFRTGTPREGCSPWPRCSRRERESPAASGYDLEEREEIAETQIFIIITIRCSFGCGSHFWQSSSKILGLFIVMH